jgi:uncharacterized membrane protein YozB (DUF420 family)
MFNRIIQKIENYGIPAMIAVMATAISIFAGLIIITNGIAFFLIPIIGIWVIIKAWIDVKEDERKYMGIKTQREEENV